MKGYGAPGRRWLILILSGIPLLPGAGRLTGQEFHLNLEREKRVRFVSDAPLEDFEGVTDRIDGFLFLAGDGLGGETDLNTSDFYFEVDLGSLDTGIGMRNRHMRENYLDTDEYPFASFAGRIASIHEETSGQYGVTTSGVLAIHGVKKDREIECAAEAVGRDLRVRCAFRVSLSDHDIPIPRLMFMKIDDVMELDLDFFLSPVGGGEGE